MRKILTEEEFIHAFDTGIEINERTLLEFAYGGVEQQIGENRSLIQGYGSICALTAGSFNNGYYLNNYHSFYVVKRDNRPDRQSKLG